MFVFFYVYLVLSKVISTVGKRLLPWYDLCNKNLARTKERISFPLRPQWAVLTIFVYFDFIILFINCSIVWKLYRWHCWGELKYLLLHMNALVAVSKGMWAVCEVTTSQLIARVIVVELNVFFINDILQLILTALWWKDFAKYTSVQWLFPLFTPFTLVLWHPPTKTYTDD